MSMVTDHHHQEERCLREMRSVMGIVLGGGITILHDSKKMEEASEASSGSVVADPRFVDVGEIGQ
jgi:hypothetical protein